MITTSQIVLYKNLHSCKIKKRKEKRAATISKGFFLRKTFKSFARKVREGKKKKKKKLSSPHVD
jgi:hypothetical protein